MIAGTRKMAEWCANFFPVNPPPPPLSYGAEKRRDHRNLPYAHAISVIPPLLSTITQGGEGSPEKNSDSSVSQLSALATLRPIWGPVLKAPLSYLCHKLGSAIFWSDPRIFGYIY